MVEQILVGHVLRDPGWCRSESLMFAWAERRVKTTIDKCSMLVDLDVLSLDL